MSTTAIIIPARYGSTRFPGKPLAMIAGVTMIERVVAIARKASEKLRGIQFIVATEDDRIAEFCQKRAIPVVMTGDDCATGSDRVYQAVQRLNLSPDFVLGLQGDAPFTPLSALTGVIETLEKFPAADVATPIVRLRWDELEQLRRNKQITPFSGTTTIVNATGKALWFSKNIIPAIRKEDDLKHKSEFSPVLQHLGLYGFRLNALKKFISLPPSTYESLEGLEQLRMVENGIHVQTVTLNINLGMAQSGVDSPEDVVRAETIIAKYGDPMKDLA